MEKRVKQLAFVVGVDKTEQGTCYRVILAQFEQKPDKTFNWNFIKKMLNEGSIVQSMKKGLHWANVKYADGKLKGSSGELSRFNNKVNRPIVIISRITDGNGKVLGYKVADYNGNVINKSLNDMLNYGVKVAKGNGVPVQNAKFMTVSETNKRPFYSAFPGCNFIEEIVVRRKNTNASNIKKVDTAKNSKTLNNLTDIYTKEQIKELKGGKSEGLNIKIYANPQLSAKQMSILRYGLKKKVNVRPIAFPEFKEDVMKYYVADLINGIDIRPYVNSKYSLGQVACLSTAYDLGLDIGSLADPNLSAEDMEREKDRLASQLWKSLEVETDSSWK